MTDNSTIDPPVPPVTRKAFRIRELREAYGQEGLTREELAELAGISLRRLDALEACAELSPTLFGLFRIAFALQIPVEALVEESRLNRVRGHIARRRYEKENAEERPPIGFAVREL